MSAKIQIDSLNYDIRHKINEDLTIKLENNKYSKNNSKIIFSYEILDEYIYLPFSYTYKELKFPRIPRTSFTNISIPFDASLRPEQEVVKKEAINVLSKRGSVLLSCYCGFGKSITAINIASTIGFKTLVIVNKIVLLKQWEDSINLFCPDVKVQKITPQNKNTDADFFLINAINVPKMGKNFFQDIGTVIVDESHLIMAETLSKSLQNVFPRYLLGLTATPYRPDGLDILLELYFGKIKIVRKLKKEHTVYIVNTNFTPKIELMKNGRINWNVVLDSQANNEQRNELIIRIVQYFSNRIFLILVKRVVQGNFLVEKLLEKGESVTSLLGSQQIYDPNARILISTNSKCGTGFDHPKLDALLLAGDLEEYFIQYIGRVMRRPDVEPLIFDLLDNNNILKKHFKTRRSIYLELGGKIKNLDVNIL